MKFYDLLDAVSRRKTPKLSKDFWAKFDGELSRRLDEVDGGRISLKAAFADAISDFVSIFRNPEFRRALVTASLAVMVVSFVLMSSTKGQPKLYSVASLPSDELVDELVIIDASSY